MRGRGEKGVESENRIKIICSIHVVESRRVSFFSKLFRYVFLAYFLDGLKIRAETLLKRRFNSLPFIFGFRLESFHTSRLHSFYLNYLCRWKPSSFKYLLPPSLGISFFCFSFASSTFSSHLPHASPYPTSSAGCLCPINPLFSYPPSSTFPSLRQLPRNIPSYIFF